MIQRIVVAYDGSEQARAAYDAALMLARAAGAGILAVYIDEPDLAEALAVNPGMALDPLAPPAMAPPLVIEGEGRLPDGLEDEFEALGHECRVAGIAYESRFGRGPLVDWLVREAQPTDMIAVGLKGRFARGGVGSTTRALATQAPCPVLVVNRQLGPVNRVMTVFDGTGAAEAAVAFSIDLGRRANWPVTVLAMARGKVTLDRAMERAGSLAPDAQVLPLGDDRGSGGDVWQAELIERATGKDRYALLVLGAYADSALKDVLLGSTTGHVLSHLGGAAVLVHG
jgi:nucleotide-binding universal stress UspA family protein